MKSILVLSIVLFFVVAPAFAQMPLSDATGFINRLNVETSGHVFEIKLVSNFDLPDYTFEKDNQELIIYVEKYLSPKSPKPNTFKIFNFNLFSLLHITYFIEELFV